MCRLRAPYVCSKKVRCIMFILQIISWIRHIQYGCLCKRLRSVMHSTLFVVRMRLNCRKRALMENVYIQRTMLIRHKRGCKNFIKLILRILSCQSWFFFAICKWFIISKKNWSLISGERSKTVIGKKTKYFRYFEEINWKFSRNLHLWHIQRNVNILTNAF